MGESFASEDCEGCVGCRNSLVFIYIDERYVENPPTSRSRVDEWWREITNFTRDHMIMSAKTYERVGTMELECVVLVGYSSHHNLDWRQWIGYKENFMRIWSWNQLVLKLRTKLRHPLWLINESTKQNNQQLLIFFPEWSLDLYF